MRVRVYIAMLWLTLWTVVPALASEAAEESGQVPSVFEGYFGESIWTLLWFFVLLIVLWIFAWKPILGGLTSRQEHIERQIADAEKTRADARKVLAEYQGKLSDADRQGREIISAKVKEAQKQAMEVEHVKQREIDQMKQRAEVDLERERLEAEESLWLQAGDIVRQLGREVFGKALDSQDNQKLIDEAIAKLREQHGSADRKS